MDSKRLKQLALENLLSSSGVSTYTISGTVYDADGTTPVSGATVALGALSAVSAANGTYTISNVPAGTSGSMTCTKAGYIWPAITVAAMSGNLTSQNYTNAWYLAGGTSGSIVAAYNPFGAANQASSYVNVANPGTYNCTVGVAPTWAQSTGWTFNGVDQYLNTGVAPVKQLWTLIVRFTNFTQGTNTMIARCSSAVGSFGVGSGNATLLYYGSGDALSPTASIANGVMAVAGNKAYRNGAAETGTIPDAGAIGANNLYIGCRNNIGTPISFAAVTVTGVAIHNATLTQPQVAMIGSASLPLA